MASRGEGMSYIIPPSSPKVEVMKFNKTGQTDLTNLPYIFTADSLVDLGSTNWTETTTAADHPSMEITSDFGVKFLKTGYYRVDSGLFMYGTAPVSGTTAIISQNLISTDAPDPTATSYWPTPDPNGDVSYNRFDLALANNSVLGLDPDLNDVIKVESPNMIIYFYVRISGTPSDQAIVRATTNSYKLSTMAITRIGDL